MNKIILAFSILVAVHSKVLAGDEKNIVSATLQSATVYRSGATLTHSAKALLKQGNNELVIQGLSNNLDLASVQIGSTEKLTILSVEFSTDFLKPAVKTVAVKRLEDSLETVNRQLDKLQVQLKTDADL